MSKKIRLDPDNFNRHTDAGMDLLRKSVQEVGVIESIAVDADDVVITGNARKEVFDEMGMQPRVIELADNEYPVIKTSLSGEDRVKAAILANTVSAANLNIDTQLISEVAIEQYGVTVEDYGVVMPAPGVPPELDGDDLMPEKLADIFGTDETLTKRVVITYTDDERSRLEAFLRLPLSNKMLYTAKELFDALL